MKWGHIQALGWGWLAVEGLKNCDFLSKMKTTSQNMQVRCNLFKLALINSAFRYGGTRVRVRQQGKGPYTP